MSEQWTQQEAIALCVAVEAFAPQFGCHVALTGGLLYKYGPRKDADLLFYRIRQVDKVDFAGLLAALETLGILSTAPDSPRWCVKAMYHDKPVDLFFPDHGGEYPTDSDDDQISEPATTEVTF